MKVLYFKYFKSILVYSLVSNLNALSIQIKNENLEHNLIQKLKYNESANECNKHFEENLYDSTFIEDLTSNKEVIKNKLN